MERDNFSILVISAVVAAFFAFWPATAGAEAAGDPLTEAADSPDETIGTEEATDPLNEPADPMAAEDFAFTWEDDPLDDFEEESTIADPLEPLNRVVFEFNDRLYFWILQPVASNYARVVPAGVRSSIFNFFYNLRTPVRVVNNLLQAKPRETGVELSRFIINTTLGVGGLGDPARKRFGLESQIEDLGQTFGSYGMGGGIFIVWPFLGASNLRDSIGMLGDSFLSPLEYYIREEPVPGLAVATFQYVNRTSFRINDYEQFKALAFDPYLSLRDAYQQYRQNLIEDRHQQTGQPFYTWNGRRREKLAAFPGTGSAEKDDRRHRFRLRSEQSACLDMSGRSDHEHLRTFERLQDGVQARSAVLVR